jgi:hypothetical protein
VLQNEPYEQHLKTNNYPCKKALLKSNNKITTFD